MRYTRFACAAALFAAATPFHAQAADLDSVVVLTGTNRLVTLDIDNPGATPTRAPRVKALAEGEGLVGIDHRPADGALYGVTNTGRILRLRANNGAVLSSTEITGATLDGAAFGVDFNPVPDRLRLVTSNGQNLRINVDTGAALVDGELNPGQPLVSAAAYTNAAAGTGSTTLYVIDTNTNQLLIQSPPNDGTLVAVGALGVDATAINGFDIRATDNLALASLRVNGEFGLYRIELGTGAATLIGTFDALRNARGLSIPTPDTKLFVLTGNNRLARFSPPNFTNTDPLPPLVRERVRPVTGLQSGETLVGIDFRPATGDLVGLGSGGAAYLIDPVTGVASDPVTLVPDAADNVDGNDPYSALVGAEFGVDFNPVPDRLRTVSDAGQNLRSNVNAAAGGTFSDGAITGFTPAPAAAAYTNAFGAADPMRTTQLFVIDAASDRLYLQSPPNDGTLADVGALGVAIDGVGGFDIAGADTALAALTPTGGSAALYTVNLSTGAATLVGAFGEPVADIAHPITETDPAADSTMFALGTDGLSLFSFARSAPGVLTPVEQISGLGEGETVLGIDFRPSSSALYALGSSGKLYTVDTTTAVATLASTLAAADIMLDPTPDFAGLVGTNFGVDFNPVPDRLRVISDGLQNLRINVDSGGTITDGTINRPAPVLVAAAYANSFPGGSTAGSGLPGSTTLYVLEAGEDRLAIQSPPNNGVITPVGALGVDIPTTGVSFDIAGGANGLAYAAFDGDADGVVELYRVSLSTGAATLVGELGVVSDIKGMSIRLR